MKKKTQGAIAAGHEDTAKAAIRILEEGGNAFDAAIAALLASFVSEPCMSSAGGGAFMTAHTHRGENLFFDCFCQTPKVKKPEGQIDFFPVELDFGTVTEVFHVGLGSVGVPGTIAGAFKMHESLGSLPFKVLAEPAIEMAKNGVVVDAFQYHDFHLLEPILSLSKDKNSVFYHNGELVHAGEVMKMPQLADTLDYLVREGRDGFYRGEIGKMLLKFSEEKGGMLTRADLEGYEVKVRRPLAFPYRDRMVLTSPLPCTGGSMMAILMASLASYGPVTESPRSAEHVYQLMETLSGLYDMKRTPANLQNALAKWYPGRFPKAGEVSNTPKTGGTSHFSILDEAGNAASLSMSIGEGCGYFLPGTDINLNNMLGEVALLPHGLHSWEEDVRLASMMSPSIVLDAAGHAEIVIGSGGASRIPGMIGQVLHYLIDHGLDVVEAVHAPRIHCHAGECNLEPGFEEVKERRGRVDSLIHWDKQSLFFGGTHTLVRKGDHIEVEGDQRRGGIGMRTS